MKILNILGLLFFTCLGLQAQGIINSGGYIQNSGAPHIIISNASLDNSGTWTKATEVVTFTGTLTSELKGSTSSYANLVMDNSFATGTMLNTTNVVTCDNLTINASAVFTIAPTSKLLVSTALTNNGGNAGLVIKSDVTGSGSLIYNTAGVPGTVEQYHTDSSYVYHMVSSPISDATAAVFKFSSVSTYVYSYDAATPAWVNITTSATALAAGVGYLVNYHNVAVDRTSIYAGTLNASAISPTLDATASRFNFVGNPFPCSIDWDGAGWTKTNVGSLYYLWLPAKGSYGTYNTSGAVSVNGIDNIIHSGQGFFVHSSGTSPALTIGTATKIHNTSILKSARQALPLLKLHISNDANTFSDETVVLFTQNATVAYDDGIDALKKFTLSSESSQIYTSSDDMSLVINAMPATYSDSIPLFFKCNKEANYTIELVNNTWTDTITLTDLIANKTVLLTDNKYTFSALKTDTTRRFVLNRKKTAAPVVTTINGSESSGVNIYSNGNKVYLANKTGRQLKGELVISGITGQQISRENNVELISEIERNIVLSGVYIVTYRIGNYKYVKKVIIGNN